MSNDEKYAHFQATVCFLCETPFSEKNYKVIHQSHLNGQYLGAAHNECNLKASKKYVLPVIFHRLQNYDAHVILQDIAAYMPGNFFVIARNLENYITLKLRVKSTKVKLIIWRF